MSVSKRLAIVIPAYKQTYLREALDSIASQTSNDFTLYIGDDNSPENLSPIIQSFQNRIDLVYHRFPQNLGGKDLVAHWHRCIDLTKQEEWIWLFSDDDIMEANCVQTFFQSVDKYTYEDLFHFDVQVIDEKSKKVGKLQPFPEKLSVKNFFSGRIKYKISSFVIEYIFSRKTYETKGGFEKFDLAWCSDDATWIKFGVGKGITTLNGAIVNWRYSGINISSKIEDTSTLLRKINASEEYIRWVNTFLSQNGKKPATSPFKKMKWIVMQLLASSSLTLEEKWKRIKKILNSLGYQNISSKMRLYLYYMEMKKRWKNRS
jgi:glycosyltransferase involved in cell wall biosynthesis